MKLDRTFLEQAMPVASFTFKATRLAWKSPIAPMRPALAFICGTTRVAGPLVAAQSGVVEALALPLRALVGTRVLRELTSDKAGPAGFMQRGLLGAAADRLPQGMGGFAAAVGAGLAIAVGLATRAPSQPREQAWRASAANLGVRIGVALQSALETLCTATNMLIYAAALGVNLATSTALIFPLAVLVGAGCALHQAQPALPPRRPGLVPAPERAEPAQV